MESAVSSNQVLEQVTFDSSEKQNSPVLQSKEESLLDFSSMFKNNGFVKRPMPKLGVNRKTQSQGPNWLLQIPAKLQISISDMEERRYINGQKWKMIVKTNSQQQSPAAALLTCVNYLVKNNLPSQTTLFNFKQIKDQMSNPTLTRRQNILNGIEIIQQQYEIKWLQSKVYQIQSEGKNQQFLNYVTRKMKSKQTSFFYVCYGQVLCPIGFQITPLVPLDAYKKLGEIHPQKLEMWIIFASPLKGNAPFVIKRWTDIQKEMSSRWPQYLDLEQTKKGRQTYEETGNEVSPAIKQQSCWIELICSQLLS